MGCLAKPSDGRSTLARGCNDHQPSEATPPVAKSSRAAMPTLKATRWIGFFFTLSLFNNPTDQHPDGRGTEQKIQLLSQKSCHFDGRCDEQKSTTNGLLTWADLLENPVGSHSVCPVGNRVAAWLRQNMQRHSAGQL